MNLGNKGSEIWDKVWSNAEWLDKEADYDLVMRYCENWDFREALQQVIDTEGYTVENTRGAVSAHPAIKELRYLEDAMLRMESKMGLTPSDRKRLGLEIGSKEKTKLKSFQDGEDED